MIFERPRRPKVKNYERPRGGGELIEMFVLVIISVELEPDNIPKEIYCALI